MIEPFEPLLIVVFEFVFGMLRDYGWIAFVVVALATPFILDEIQASFDARQRRHQEARRNKERSK